MNTTLTFPVSGQTIGTNGTSVTYTANANGNGAMVYCNASMPSNTGGLNDSYLTVSVGSNNVATFRPFNSIENDNGSNHSTQLMSNAGSVNILQSVSFFGTSTTGYQVIKHPCGFPTDRNGNPYLLLRPGQTVTITKGTAGACSLTVLEL